MLQSFQASPKACTLRRIPMKLLKIKSCVAVVVLIAAASLTAYAQGNAFNTRGNILISDQFNNRVIEVNPNNHRIVWHFGNQSSVAGPHSVVGVNDAQRVGVFTLIPANAAPPGSRPNCPNVSP